MSLADEAAPMRRQWQRFTADEERESAQLYADGKTVRQIAEWLDHPAGSVYLMLKRLGVEFRPRGTTKAAL